MNRASPACARESEAGFSLVETLVALLVLAIAAAGLVRAAEAHVDTIRGLQMRAAAEWVAQNRLVELALGRSAAQDDGRPVEMLGMSWRVGVTSRPTDDRDLAAVEVSVAEAGGARPLVTLSGFVDTGAGRP